MMNLLFKKTILAAMVVALAFAALPISSVFAADEPPAAKDEVSNERLELAWARELRAYERLGQAFDRSDAFVEMVQARIGWAAANGKDVTAVQAALDAFEAAIKDAHPVYESAKGIVNSHKGFDENGEVTDAEQAKETVQEMKDKLNEVKSAMGGTGKALREAVKAFREANKPAETPTEQP